MLSELLSCGGSIIVVKPRGMHAAGFSSTPYRGSTAAHFGRQNVRPSAAPSPVAALSGLRIPQWPGNRSQRDPHRRRGLQKSRTELLAVGPIVDPFARRGNPVARRDRGRLADDGHEIAMPAGLGSENAEPVLFVVKGDPLDQTGQQFLRSRLRFGPHPANDRLPRRCASASIRDSRGAFDADGKASNLRMVSSAAAAARPAVTRTRTEHPLQHSRRRVGEKLPRFRRRARATGALPLAQAFEGYQLNA